MAAQVPVARTLTLGAGASGSINFGEEYGRAMIRIIGSGTMYVQFNGTPGAAPVDGQFTLDSQCPFFNDNDISFSTIGFYAVNALRVEVLAQKSVHGIKLK
jgi:hypothetical protein